MNVAVALTVLTLGRSGIGRGVCSTNIKRLSQERSLVRALPFLVT